MDICIESEDLAKPLLELHLPSLVLGVEAVLHTCFDQLPQSLSAIEHAIQTSILQSV